MNALTPRSPNQKACLNGAARCIGKTKGGLNTEVTAVVDARGRVVAFCLAPGNRHDLKAMADITSVISASFAPKVA